MKYPLVSVIIPFMNEEKLLEESINSVLYQDYPNIELLLVDDGSTDNSSSIAKRYASEQPSKIYYFHHDQHKNFGVSATRNLGINKANGEYIAFLDADDYFMPGKISEQVGYFLKYPEISMAAEASVYWYDWMDSDLSNRKVLVGSENDKVIHPPQLMLDLYPLSKGTSPCPCSLMVKKSLMEKIGGFEANFNKEYQLYEDQAILAKIYLTEKVYISSNANNYYRQRPESIVQQAKANGNYHRVRKFFFLWLDDYLDQKNVSDKRIKSLLKENLLRYRWPIFYKIKTMTFKRFLRSVKFKYKNIVLSRSTESFDNQE